MLKQTLRLIASLVIIGTVSAMSECKSTQDLYEPCCDASDTTSVDLDLQTFCDKNANEQGYSHLKAFVQSKFTASQLESFNLTGTTLRTAYSNYGYDLYDTPFGQTGLVKFNLMFLAALTGASLEVENDWGCGPHYNMYDYVCDVHIGWSKTSTREASFADKGEILTWDTFSTAKPLVTLPKSLEADALQIVQNAVAEAGMSYMNVTVDMNVPFSASHPYLASQALIKAGYLYVHHPGAACTDNLQFPTAGNVTLHPADLTGITMDTLEDIVVTSETNAILYNSKGTGAYDVDLLDVMGAQLSKGRKSFSLQGGVNANYANDFTQLEWENRGVLGCTEYENVIYIEDTAMGKEKAAKLKNAVIAARNFLTKGAVFFRETKKCVPAMSSPYSPKFLFNSLDMTNYCDSSSIFEDTRYTGEVLVTKN